MSKNNKWVAQLKVLPRRTHLQSNAMTKPMGLQLGGHATLQVRARYLLTSHDWWM